MHSHGLRALAMGGLLGIRERMSGAEATGHGPEFYHALLEQATDLVAVFAPDGTILYASPSCERILGRAAEDLIGASAYANVHPDDLTLTHSALARAVAAGGAVVEATFRLRHSDGSYRLMEATGISRLSDPVVRGVVVNAHDITERVQAEQERRALLERERKSLAALLTVADTLVQPTWDPDGGTHVAEGDGIAQHLLTLVCEVLGARRAAITMLTATGQWKPEASTGLTAEQDRLWREDVPGVALRHFLTVEEQAQIRADGILILDLSQDPRRPHAYLGDVQTLLFAALSAGTRLVGVLAVDCSNSARQYTAEDLAVVRAAASLAGLAIERDRLLRERAESEAKSLAMREAQRRMDEFLALASHELRSPLASVSGNLQIAERRLLQASHGEDVSLVDLGLLVSRAQRGINRMNALVNDLLDISRMLSEQLVMHLEPCDVLPLIRDAVDELRDLDGAQDMHLELPEGRVPCLADPARISQVVHNYLSNALKYTPRDAPVEIGARVEGAEVRIWVRDTGPGIRPEDQNHLWERFYRVDGSDRQSGSHAGLGMGLYISKMIVAQHGGKVGVESTVGVGATFWFTIPILQAVPESLS